MIYPSGHTGDAASFASKTSKLMVQGSPLVYQCPENTNLRGSITVRVTSCLFCLDSAALLMFDEQQFYLFGQIQTSQTEGQLFSDTFPNGECSLLCLQAPMIFSLCFHCSCGEKGFCSIGPSVDRSTVDGIVKNK